MTLPWWMILWFGILIGYGCCAFVWWLANRSAKMRRHRPRWPILLAGIALGWSMFGSVLWLATQTAGLDVPSPQPTTEQNENRKRSVITTEQNSLPP